MYEQITANKRKSLVLFAGFLLIYAAIGGALYWYSGPVAAGIVAVFAAAMVAIALWGGDDLAVRVAGGVQIERKEQAPEFWRRVENLAITAGVPMPRLYVSPDPSPNAFAAGRTPKQAVVCVNQGLLDLLDDQELEGVIAHEMSHIRNYDVRLMTYAAVLAGSIALVAQLALRVGIFGGGRNRRDSGPLGLIVLLATVILAPLAATIIQLSISRRREYVADAAAVELTRYPQGLAAALRKISGDDTPPEREERAIAHLMIAPQLSMRGKASTLFSTHPPTEDRIAKLDEMAGGVRHDSGRPVSETFVERGQAWSESRIDGRSADDLSQPAPQGMAAAPSPQQEHEHWTASNPPPGSAWDGLGEEQPPPRPRFRK